MKIKQTSDQWRVTSDEWHGAHPGHASRVTVGRSASVPGRSNIARTGGLELSNAPVGSTLLRPGRAHSQSGVALVITLIMLSVTLVMAVAFLAIARRERGSVTTTTEATTSRLAAETARAAAEAQIVANIRASTNLAAYDYSLLVSTNYINDFGYVPGFQNPTNVNFDYRSDNNPLNSADLIQNVANLYFLPRAPVFVNTNRVTGSNEFRYYLDLNRNRQFEANGFVPSVDRTGFTNGTMFAVGDPEWVGILERPDQPHGPNNKFIARYAFLAQPIGNSLDLNALHNQVLNRNLAAQDGFFRNQGVGSWELNLAAFLADLNTNQWLPSLPPDNVYYAYNQPVTGFANQGRAFDDARALLAYRYDFNYGNLATVQYLYGNNGATVFENDRLDGYTDGPLQTTLNTNADFLADPAKLTAWVGADNPNRYFTLGDFFDKSKTQKTVVGPGFTDRLLNAGTNTLGGNTVPTYDRYTFYRMLSELGVDSAPVDSRMNLNYRNVTNGVVVAGMETNFYPWTALEFFTNAADRMLRHYTTNWFAANPNSYLWTYYGYTHTNYIAPNGLGVPYVQYILQADQVPAFSITNIPVYVNGIFVYSPSVNRLLQLAANLYDASTNSPFPSVFRPTFYRDSVGNLFINGYVDVSKANTIAVGTPPLDIPVFDNSFLVLGASVNTASGNAYGVPWIIGAKKGLPSFNEFYTRNSVQLTRKLQVTRTDVTKPGATATNQMFIMGITNRIGFSFWNSYNTNYVASVPNGLTVYFHDFISMGLTNNAPKSWPSFYGNLTTFPFTFITNLNAWTGSFWTNSQSKAPENQTAAPQSFIAGVYDFPFLPESIFRASINDFQRVSTSPNPLWELNSSPAPFPQFGLLTTNRVQGYILDGNHVIDYVQFSGPNGSRPLSAELDDPNDSGSHHYMWSTNRTAAGAIYGPSSQITVSKHPALLGITKWKTPTDMPQALNTVDLESKYFDAFFTGAAFVNNQVVYRNTNLTLQVPYTPTRTAWDFVVWQANDPLVHYTVSDLNTSTRETGPHRSDNLGNTGFPVVSLTKEGERYQPWGRNQQMAFLGETSVDTNSYNLRFRDPLVWGSDYWDFPTGKYPTVGWLGRVHRGTPWQTIYLKQRDVLAETVAGGTLNFGTNTWAQWTGNTRTAFGQQYDAANSAPVRDSDLFDLFTTQFNDNASRGTLSVNQTHLAAWSAVFSGVAALTNLTGFPANYSVPVLTNFIVLPAGAEGNNSALGLLVNGTLGINATRAAFTNADGLVGAFEHVGDILRVPAYSERSPFLNTSSSQQRFDISDQLYEWLPQQTLGLLRVSDTPRYVIEARGQALKPAVNGEVLSSGTPNYFGLVTNYQVTAETSVRAVIRVEKQVTATSTNYTTVVESYNPLPPD